MVVNVGKGGGMGVMEEQGGFLIQHRGWLTFPDFKWCRQGRVKIISLMTFRSSHPMHPPPARFGTGGAQGKIRGHKSASECGNTADEPSESMKGQKC
ncbi:uncharacterized [Tachysurus ichikawai]